MSELVAGIFGFCIALVIAANLSDDVDENRVKRRLMTFEGRIYKLVEVQP